MTPRLRRFVWAAAAAAFALALRLPSLNLLLDRDEGEYATLAWLWRRGLGVPYRDFLEQKPPLATAMYALAQALFRDGVHGLRILSAGWTAAAAVALFLLVERLGERGRLGERMARDPRARAAAAGFGALAAGALFSCARAQGLAANTESWQALPLTGAFALAFAGDADPGAVRLLGAGACLGAASLFKQPVLCGVALLPWAMGPRGRGRAAAWIAAGALLPWVAAWALLQRWGAGSDFLDCVLVYDRGYVLQGISGALPRALGLARWLLPEWGAFAALAWLGWRALGRAGAPRGPWAAWLGVGLVSLAASGRFYPHYALTLAPPVAVLAGLGLAGLLEGLPGWSPRRFPRFLRVGLLAWAVLGYVHCDAGLWLRPGAAQRTLRLYGVTSFANAPEAAARIRRLCPADKALFLWGDDAELYYLARRRPANRFLFVYPFTGEAPPWPGGEEELLGSLLAPSTGAAALTLPLKGEVPLQKALLDGLEAQYVPDPGVPGFLLGARRR